MNHDDQRSFPPLPGQDPRRSYPRGFVPVLAIALAVSLLTNLVVLGRLQEERDQGARAEARIEQQQDALDALRGGLAPQEDGPLARIIAAVERIRGLEFTERVEPDLLTSEQLAARVRTAFREDTDREEFEANQKVLAVFGLVDPEDDLFNLVRRAQEEQIGGFYDTREKVMVIETRNANAPTALDQVLLSHEFTHAVTDQHFDLGRLDKLQEARDDDEAFAFLSLVEGDAQLVSQLYVRAVMTEDEQAELFAEIGGIDTQEFDSLPAFLRETFEFPYTKGLEFVQAIHRRGGFEALDEAYRDPPVSTEQILHPAKYLADERDDPVQVTLPDVRAALGTGWTQIDAGGIGELDLLVIADEGAQSFSRTDARKAADGWDGGRYVGLSSDRGVLVAVETVWDSESEAREAATLFGRWLPLRYGNVGGPFDAGTGNRGWASDEGAGVIRRNGDRLTMVLGPDRASVERAASAFRA